MYVVLGKCLVFLFNLWPIGECVGSSWRSFSSLKIKFLVIIRCSLFPLTCLFSNRKKKSFCNNSVETVTILYFWPREIHWIIQSEYVHAYGTIPLWTFVNYSLCFSRGFSIIKSNDVEYIYWILLIVDRNR